MYLSFFRLFYYVTGISIFGDTTLSPLTTSLKIIQGGETPSPVYLLHVQQWQIWIRERRKQWLANVPQGWSWGKGSGHSEMGWQVTLRVKRPAVGRQEDPHSYRKKSSSRRKARNPKELGFKIHSVSVSCHFLFPPLGVFLCWGGVCAYEFDCGCPHIPEYLFLNCLNPMELELEVVRSQLPAIGAGNWTQICWEKKNKTTSALNCWTIFSDPKTYF